jgi:hypothetical protein
LGYITKLLSLNYQVSDSSCIYMAMFTHRRLLSIIGYLRLAAAVPLISISWVLSQDGESPMAACHRLNPQYIELPNEFQLTWDVTALNGALSYINNRISPSVINPYGILGCCASVSS